MTKFGVGVGEEFPVDEQNRSQEQDDGGEGEAQRCGHRARHEAWHRFRDQLRAEWRDRRRAFHDSRGRRDGVEAMDDFRVHHMHRLVIGGLALVGLAALLSIFHSRR